MSKHTPGPWSLAPNSMTILKRDEHGNPVRHIAYSAWDKTDARAFLDMQLAAAAPELLEALEHFASLPLEEFAWEDKKDDHPITGFNEWSLKVGHIRKARAAIRKAKGEA